MNKRFYIVISLTILFLTTLFAINPILQIRKADSVLESYYVSGIDSLKFTQSDNMYIFSGGKILRFLPFSEIDSMYFVDADLLPTVEMVSVTFNYKTKNSALCTGKVTSDGGSQLTERGIVWATHTSPTLADSKFASGYSVGQFYATMSNLVLNQDYYIRAYATNGYGTSYSEQVKFTPTPGNVTYTLAQSVADAGTTVYNLINAAMDSACWYYNRYTTFRCNIWVYYNAGIPTAQASYHGSIGFGSGTTYMWVGTAMHEMAHFMGSGTTTVWQDYTNTTWTGPVASALLLAETGEVLGGDNAHFWPYGINYKTEITNLGGATAQKNGLILHAKLVQAMCVDDCGLPTSW